MPTAAGADAAFGAPFRLAHLSDPHLAQPLALAAPDLVSKRFIGFLSWRLKRRHIHRPEVLAALTGDLLAQRPDHVAVTGDIVNIALVAEFGAAAAWLAGLGPADRVSVVPGNHDAYVQVPFAKSLAAWCPYMTSDDAAARAADAPADQGPAANAGCGFPFIRRRGRIALVGLTTAIATLPGLASGVVGTAQLAAAAARLAALGREGLFRIILIHHPPVTAPGSRRKRLIDAKAFAAMLQEAGAELVLHGHDHFPRLYELPGRDGPVCIAGVASASALPVDGHRPAGYHLFDIAPTPDGWAVELRTRSIDAALAMRETARRSFRIGRPTPVA